ncbi:MAG: CHASE domain-containing protein [Candidatus Aenigmatarchaeota archaeon]|nr:MAG: CHASE domain-containing protein [Candidatus Aenigmarchaeota archaeon]
MQKTLIFAAAIFAAVALAWTFAVTPEALEIQNNFHYSADVASTDNFYNEETDAYNGKVGSVTRFSYETVSSKGDVRTIKNNFNVRKPTGEKIFSVERLYGIDAKSGRHVADAGDRVRNGYLFGPRHADKSGYVYWHVNYDEPANLIFKGEETLNGLMVYRYETDYRADQTANLGHLPGVPESRGVNLDINLRVWIEPTSGYLVKYEDRTIAYYYNIRTGERIAPWNSFHNEYTQESIATHIAEAKIRRDRVLWYDTAIPGAFVALAVMLLTIAFRLRGKEDVLVGASWTTLAPFAILVVGLIVTFIVWQSADAAEASRAHDSFNAFTGKLESSIGTRMASYEQAMIDAKAFAEGVEVDSSKWRKFAATQDLKRRLPGIQGIGFDPYVRGAVERNELVARLRSEGLSGFSVTPAGDRETYVPVAYLEPLDEANEKAIGYDVYSEPTRRRALEQALETGQPVITGPLTIVQDVAGVPFKDVVIFVPVYDGEPSTIEERNNAITGFVSGPIIVKDLIVSAIGENPGVGIEIYDSAIRPENLLYESGSGTVPVFTRTAAVPVAGRDWIVVFKGSAAETASAIPLFILAAGVASSLLLFSIVYSYYNGFRARTAALRQTVEALSQGKTDVTIDDKLKMSKDEIGDLARAFDRVLISLKLAMQMTAPEITKEKERLEEAVREKEEAKKELAIKNQQLQMTVAELKEYAERLKKK